MRGITQQGQNALQDVAMRYNISFDSACSMLDAVNNGGGTMAQFSIPELGGGQWMQGGMTMCGDMFNHGLQAMVNNLCSELSRLLATTQVYEPLPKGAASFGMGNNNWWPAELGVPSASGGQNDVRYAYFANSRRLAVNLGGGISIYDTLDHQIGGVQQQQGGGSSVTFTSQYGTVDPINLPLISGPGSAPVAAQASFQQTAAQPAEQQAVPQPTEPQDSDGVFKRIQQLSDLYNSGALTQQEFESKKSELLARL